MPIPLPAGSIPKSDLLTSASFWNRCIAGTPNFEPLVLTRRQHDDIKRLHEHFRNNFAHFIPKGWSIERVGLPRIIEAALYAAEILMNRVAHRLDEDQQRRLKEALATARRHLENP
jgi:hypothetical protein